ncbi:MAG TPA: peptidoglycan DD-metalloendopeptidase family protein [Spirochaetia bacterium]|nr:peptidoglycan DD-metalloendopeptidase family protein [Spirochaetia bacterium]
MPATIQRFAEKLRGFSEPIVQAVKSACSTVTWIAERIGHSVTAGYSAVRRSGTPGILAIVAPAFFIATVFTLMLATAPRNMSMDVVHGPPVPQLEYVLRAADSDTSLPPETNLPIKMPDVNIPDALRVVTYHVKAGDTISEIAQNYGVSDETIISFNGVDDARLIQPGTELEIPTMNGILYRVRPGDTLAGIADSHKVNIQDVQSINDLRTTLVLPNQELFLPGAHMNMYAYRKALGTLFIWPTQGVITSRFGMRRDPFTGTMEFHAGVDIANSIGTPIDAAMDGQVVAVGQDRGYGNYILIDNGGGYRTLYAHLSAWLVSRGQWVRSGQQIGRMGDTGYSTGPHLHFGIFKDYAPVNPLIYLR